MNFRGCSCHFRTFLSFFLFILSLVVTAKVYSDDISVFGNISSSQKPNILFLLDYSGSMELDLQGTVAVDSGKPSRLDILINAVETVLNDNEQTINVGMSVFKWGGTGIKWPISDLMANASEIDPQIPASAGLTSKDVLLDLLRENNTLGNTATVQGLLEAALYFRGEEVSLGGWGDERVPQFKPPYWDFSRNQYGGGNELAANPITHVPQDAYKFGVQSTRIETCDDETVNGTYPHRYNACDGLNVISCVYHPKESGFDPPTPDDPGGPWVNEAYNECQYYYPDSWEGARYISPITQSCQENIIVMVSDGVPTTGWTSDPMTRLLGYPRDGCENLGESIFASFENKQAGNCGIEMVKMLYENDQRPGVPNSNVKTYTVGFGIEPEGKTYLQRLADEGGGRFFSAEDPTQLASAFSTIIHDVLGKSESFTELAIDTDRANFSDDNRVYFPLFSPSSSRAWKGNLKGYFLDEEGLKDVNNAPATTLSGNATVFTDTAQSFWSATPDGKQVAAGGASSTIRSASRVLLTYTGSEIPAGGVTLRARNDEHEIRVENRNLTTEMLGLPRTAVDTRTILINWLREAPMGDPLHSRAVPVRYGYRTTIFTMTNQGLLHGFDGTVPSSPGSPPGAGGGEAFAFMPPELLPNIQDLRKGRQQPGEHIYGLDGGITRWHDDENKDGIVNGSEKLMLIIGMRRGGNNYYALDLTNPSDPILKWRIKGGEGDFTNLAQSWSRMSLVTVKRNGKKEKVLVFGGGYDAEVMDGATERTPAKGSAIYMVDRDGKLIWVAKDRNMQYGIASDIVVIDSDDNGVADRMYATDLGGQVWRVDFDDVSVKSKFEITQLADLGASSFRPMFYPPSVSLNGRVSNQYMSVVVGTGHRANPLQTGTQNVIAMIRDENVGFGPPAEDFRSAKLSDLFNATSNSIGSPDAGIAEHAEEALKKSRGWYINLAPGEKSLSTPFSFEGKVMATTYQPKGGSNVANSCSVAGSEGRYYAMNIRDAQPTGSLGSGSNSGGATLTAADRSKIIANSGIPNSPVVAFPKGVDGAVVLVDKQAVERIEQRIARVYWHPKK